MLKLFTENKVLLIVVIAMALWLTAMLHVNIVFEFSYFDDELLNVAARFALTTLALIKIFAMISVGHSIAVVHAYNLSCDTEVHIHNNGCHDTLTRFNLIADLLGVVVILITFFEMYIWYFLSNL